MNRSFKKIMIPAICLLCINAVEEIVGYKLQQMIRDEYKLTLALMLMYASGFAFVAALMLPGTKKTVQKMHTSSKRAGGIIGLILFYVILALLLFKAYHVIYTDGPQYLLPAAWR